MKEMAKVVRFFKTGKRKVIFKNISLELAKLHCSSPQTKTEKYFDGFYIIKN